MLLPFRVLGVFPPSTRLLASAPALEANVRRRDHLRPERRRLSCSLRQSEGVSPQHGLLVPKPVLGAILSTGRDPLQP